MANGEFISYNVDKIVFGGFFFQFEARKIQCFQALFVFDFALDVLTVVYAPRVYLSEIEVNIHLLFTNNYFAAESIDTIYFVNNAIVYKVLLI